jgi:beta-N-acetylglucosaminidase
MFVSSAFTYESTAAAQTKDDITGIALEEEMRELIRLGVIYGYSEGEYRPHEEISRGQFAAFVARALELPEGAPVFTDVPAASNLAKDIYRAANAKIVNGYSEKIFRMNELVTREQMAAMIDNALIYKQKERSGVELNFTDAEQISPLFRDAVANNVNDGIISGFKNEDGTYRFNPKMEANRAQAAAFIARMLHVLDEYPTPKGYSVATIINKELVPGTGSYASFNEAKSAATNANQVVTHNGKIVSMAGGLVISGKSEGQAVTLIYVDENFKNRTTYVAPNQEMEYLGSTENYVKANLAGMTVYVKPNDVNLVPAQMVAGRSHYTVSNGDLTHHVYNHDVKAYSLGYTAGKAPAFLTAGAKYYSWDGITFYNEAGQQVGAAYQYFNYLPLRTATNYSAEEIDDFIEYMLKDRERLYNSDPVRYVRYQDVLNKSKLKGLGSYLKEVEEKYRINALFILSLGFNESDYGMSTIAQTKNNLFGLNAVDSDVGLAHSFETPAESIDGLVEKTIIAKYTSLDPSKSFYANGAVFGNKTVGMNVVYASDPFWGQKNAGYMYRADKYLKGKDYGKYQLGLTNTTGLNVRSQADALSTKYFTYPKSGMPVAILSTEKNPKDGATWYKVVSEHMDYTEAYIHGTYVTPINYVQ